MKIAEIPNQRNRRISDRIVGSIMSFVTLVAALVFIRFLYPHATAFPSLSIIEQISFGFATLLALFNVFVGGKISLDIIKGRM